MSEPRLIDNYLTVEQAADQLGLTVRAIHAMTSNGVLECFRVGRRNYLTRETLTRYIESQIQRSTRAKNHELIELRHIKLS